MIVRCTNCKARFRIGDDKVVDKPVKVKCTKCGTVFRVTRADAADAPAAPNGAAASIPGPFSAPAGPPLPAVKGAGTTPGPGGSRVVPHLPPVVSLTYGAASPHQSLDLELSLGPPMGGQHPAAMAPAPLARSPTSAPPTTMPMRAPTPTLENGASLSTSAIDMALDAAMASGASFGEVIPQPFAHAVPGLPPPLPPPPPPPAPLRSAPTGPASIVDPFNFATRAPQRGEPILHASQPAMAQAPAPMAASDPAVARMPSAPPPEPSAEVQDPWASLAAKPPREETDPFAGLDVPPGSAGALSLAAPPREAPPDEHTGTPAPAPAHDSFSSSVREIELREPTLGGKLDLDYGQLSGVGGLAAERAADEEAAPDDDQRADVARISTVPREAVEERFTAGTRIRGNPRAGREVASALLNVLSAAIVCYAAIVAVAVIRTPRPLRWDDVGFPLVWLAFGSGSADHADQLRATNIHSGIYPVASGDEVFYVDGTAENDSSRRLESMYVKLEIRRNGRLLETAYAVAGLRATPEDLYALGPPSSDKSITRNETFQRALAKRATSLTIEAHKSAPFVGIFEAKAKDVEGSEIRAIVSDGFPAAMHGALELGVPSRGDGSTPVVHPPEKTDATPAAAKAGKPVATAKLP